MKLRLLDIGQNNEIVSLKTVKDYTIYQKQGIYLTFLDLYDKEKRQILRATRDSACFWCETLWSKVSYNLAKVPTITKATRIISYQPSYEILVGCYLEFPSPFNEDHFISEYVMESYENDLAVFPSPFSEDHFISCQSCSKS